MAFVNPQFTPGLNVTVRSGRKWFDRLSVGDEFVMLDGNGLPIGDAVVEEVACLPVDRVPTDWLLTCCDGGVYCAWDLRRNLAERYPGGYDEEVSVVAFTR